MVVLAMTAADRPACYPIALAGGRLAHCLQTALDSCEKLSHFQLLMDVRLTPQLD
jgi:hypothetical protein